MLAIVIWPVLTNLASRFLFISLDALIALNIVRFIFAVLILFLLFSTIYKILPNHRQSFRDVRPGAVVATIIWLVLAQLFSIYLAHFGNYDATYGSIGGMIITLIFFHYSASIILLGAELNYVLGNKGNTIVKL